jgi:hypothetical protein
LRKPSDDSGATAERPLRPRLHPGPPDSAVPRISEFCGIVIAMYCAEHCVPHFHAIDAVTRASIAIESLAVLAGSLCDCVTR